MLLARYWAVKVRALVTLVMYLLALLFFGPGIILFSILTENLPLGNRLLDNFNANLDTSYQPILREYESLKDRLKNRS